VLSAESLRDKGDLTNSTVLFTLQDQLWSLFPGYCSHATDIPTSFKLVAKGIGTSLTKRPDLRLHLLAGLRNLISKTDDGKEESFLSMPLPLCH
jgi:ribosomal RNA-processing protein 12